MGNWSQLLRNYLDDKHSWSEIDIHYYITARKLESCIHRHSTQKLHIGNNILNKKNHRNVFWKTARKEWCI